MTLSLPKIRHTRYHAACLVISSCLLVPAASAHPQSSGADAATPNKPAAKTSATHHQTAKASTSKSSTTSSRIAKSTSKTHTASTGKRASRKKTARARGQMKIDSERAQAIQEALVREHYLTGEPTGVWNEESEEAMRRYQGDHGWQTKQVPDSRALIRLGLGPSNDHLLNPESAMTTSPVAPKAASLPTTSHTAAPAADPPASNTSSSTTPASTPASDPRPATTPVQDSGPQ